MSDEQTTETNSLYWKNVDQLIDHANTLASEQGLDSVSSSLVYAAARFSAFNAATKYKSADQLTQDKEEAIKYFTSIFKKMFEENINDYSNNFEKYISKIDSETDISESDASDPNGS